MQRDYHRLEHIWDLLRMTICDHLLSPRARFVGRDFSVFVIPLMSRRTHHSRHILSDPSGASPHLPFTKGGMSRRQSVLPR